MNVCFPKTHVMKPSAQCDGIGGWGLRRVRGVRGWSPLMGLGSLCGREGTPEPPLRVAIAAEGSACGPGLRGTRPIGAQCRGWTGHAGGALCRVDPSDDGLDVGWTERVSERRPGVGSATGVEMPVPGGQRAGGDASPGRAAGGCRFIVWGPALEHSCHQSGQGGI